MLDPRSKTTSTTSELARLGLVAALSLGLALPANAAPAAEEAPVEESKKKAEAAPDEEPASPAAVDEGDLGGRAEAAQTAREDSPSFETWSAEAEAHEARGDFEAAQVAWEGALEVAPEEEKVPVQERLDDLKERRRGKVEDEPDSTHREELDQARAKRLGLVEEGPPEPPAEPPPPKDRIVKKWYFWVTLTAIVASGAAIAGIAIAANNQERRDDLDAMGPMPNAGFRGLGFRF